MAGILDCKDISVIEQEAADTKNSNLTRQTILVPARALFKGLMAAIH